MWGLRMSRPGLEPGTIGLKVRQADEYRRLSATIRKQPMPHAGCFVCHLRASATNGEYPAR